MRGKVPARHCRERSDAPRNDVEAHLRILAARMHPSFVGMLALESQRAQGRPGARCTRGLVCKLVKERRTRAYRFSGSTPAFPAQWFDGLLRALPGERLSCHRRPRENCSPRELDTSAGVSGPHDFAVRVRAARLKRPSASTASCRTSVTIRETPLIRAGRRVYSPRN